MKRLTRFIFSLVMYVLYEPGKVGMSENFFFLIFFFFLEDFLFFDGVYDFPLGSTIDLTLFFTFNADFASFLTLRKGPVTFQLEEDKISFFSLDNFLFFLFNFEICLFFKDSNSSFSLDNFRFSFSK